MFVCTVICKSMCLLYFNSDRNSLPVHWSQNWILWNFSSMHRLLIKKLVKLSWTDFFQFLKSRNQYFSLKWLHKWLFFEYAVELEKIQLGDNYADISTSLLGWKCLYIYVYVFMYWSNYCWCMDIIDFEFHYI